MCPPHISYTPWNINMKHGSNVLLIKTMCRTGWRAVPAQVRGQTLKSNIPWIACPKTIEGCWWYTGQKLTSLRRCVVRKCQPHQLKVKVTLWGQRFEPWISCPDHLPDCIVKIVSLRSLKGFDICFCLKIMSITTMLIPWYLICDIIFIISTKIIQILPLGSKRGHNRGLISFTLKLYWNTYFRLRSQWLGRI